MTEPPSPPARTPAAPPDLPSRIDALLALSTDWYWEQDAEFRFTRLVPPECERGRDTRYRLGTRRWDNPLAHALSTTWEAHRQLLERHEPYHDFQYSLAVPDQDEPRYLSVSGEPLYRADGSFAGYRGISRDVTPQWKVRDRLQDAETLLAVAAALGRFGAWSVDVRSGEMRCSDSMRALHGIPAAQAQVDIWQLFAPEYREPLARAYRHCAGEGTPFDLEVEAQAANGERSWVRVIGVAVRDPAGRIVRVQGASQDIHKSKADAQAARQAQRETERVNAQLEERVRERTNELKRINDELASFTLAVAHDLRAPLDGITGFSHALAERLERSPDAKVTHYLARIGAGVSRMAHLIEGLLELSRIGRAAMEPRQVDVTAVARDCVEALQASGRGRPVDAQVEDGLLAWGDPRLLRTVVYNLLDHAWKSCASRNPPRVRVGREAGGIFFVQDNGASFDMERAEELFAPFSRLHTDGEHPALGISLAAARRIVERHGGHIWAEASPERGTTLRFTLAERPLRS